MSKTRSTWLMQSGGIAALALAMLQPAPVAAQTAFQGVPTVVTPGTAIVQQGPQEDVIFVLAPQAVINWRVDSPPPGNYVFLPQGRTGRFVGFNDFVVLNRILPGIVGGPSVSRLIELNGTIRSEIDLTNQNQGIQAGGSVWFYSAGGILVGGSAVINVGSLVLTSNDINTTGGLFGPGGEIRFVGTAASGPVTVSQGATITARNFFNPGGSYVALVAPRVVQAGTINADGSTALVAAQAADVRVNNGLFDISFSVGTDDPNGIVHTGTTGGPTNTSAGNQSRVYMVAIPRNNAIEMLLSGTVGFQTGGVSVVDGAIVISAGRDILAGAINLPTGTSVPASVRMGDLISLNGIDVFAEGDITVESATTACNGCRIFDVNGSANLTATNAVRMSVGRGQEVAVSGDLTLRADNGGEGGTVSLLSVDGGGPGALNNALNNGRVTVAGALTVDAVGRGRFGNILDGAGIGGNATLIVDGGSVIAGSVVVDASGFGERTDLDTGADGTGGAALLLITRGGTLNANGAAVRADGIGGGIRINAATGIEEAASLGGSGFGGTARARVDTGGTITLTPFSGGPAPLIVSADGFGSVGFLQDGNGTGGIRAAVEVGDAASAITATDVAITATGIGGVNNARNLVLSGITGGNGTGGVAELQMFGNLATNSVMLDASARGSDVAENLQFPNAPAPAGGTATGGRATVDMQAAANLPVTSLTIRSDARGGNASGLTGVGGNAVAGTAILSLNNSAQANVTNLALTANGTGGGGGDDSGDGTGGNVVVSTPPGTRLQIADLILQAVGIGGGSNPFGNAPFLTTQGGDGFGGTATVSTGGLFDLAGQLRIDAYGVGGAGLAAPGDARTSQDGNAIGGEANLLTACFGCGSTRANGIILDVTARSATGDGQAGNAQGGRAFITYASDGTALESTDGISLLATANAGFGATGGDARGGFGGVSTTSGGITALGSGTLNVSVDAVGATATGGAARVQTAQDGVISAGGITLSATANGSTSAVGGRAELVSSAVGQPVSAALISSTGAITLSAGATAIGGTATGGFAIAWADGGVIEANGNALTVDASAIGTIGNAGAVQLLANDNGGAAAIRAGAVSLTADGTVAGRIDLQDISNGPGMAFASLNAYARGPAVGPLGGIYVQSSNGPISSTGAINFESAGDIEIAASNSGGLSAVGGVTLTSRQSIRGTHAGATGPTVRGGAVAMIADLDVDFGPATTITADGNVFLSGLRNVLAASTISLTDNIEMVGGFVGAGDANAAGTLTITAAGGAVLQNGRSGGNTTVTASDITVVNSVTTGTGTPSDIVLTATGNTSLGTLNAAGNVTINSGTLTGTTSAVTAAQTIAITTTGNADFGTLTGGTGVNVTSGGYILGDTATATGAGANVVLSATDFLRMTNVRSALGAVNMTARTALVDDVSAGTSVDILTTSDTTLGNTQSGGTVTLRSTNGGVAGGTINAAGNVAITAATNATGSNLTSTAGSISVTGGIVGVGTANAATTLTLQGTSNVSLTNGTSGGTMTISGTGVIVQTARTTGAASDIVLNSTTLGTALGTATAGRDIRIAAADFIQLFGPQTAARDVLFNGARLFADGQNVTAGRNIALAFTGPADFGSLAAGNGITVTSGGIVRGTSAVAGTGDLIFNVADFLQLGTARSTQGAVNITARNAELGTVFGNSAVDVLTTDLVTLADTRSGGALTVRSTNGTISALTVFAAGNVSLVAGNSVSSNAVTSTGGSITMTGGGDVSTFSANAATTLTMLSAANVSIQTSAVSGGTMTVTGTGVIVNGARTTGAGADIVLNATGIGATLGTATAARDIRITSAGFVQLEGAQVAGRDVNLSGTQLFRNMQSTTAAGAITGTFTGDARFGAWSAGSGITLSSGGSITGNSAATTGAGGAVNLSGVNGVTVTAIQSAGTTALTAANGAIAINDLQSVGTITASGRSATINTRGGAVFANLAATAGDARVTAATGDLTVTSGTATGALALTTTQGNLTTGQLSAASIALTSNGLATLNGTTTATGALAIDARGNAAINAAVTGATMTVSSGNIAVAATGRLGTAGTTTALTLSNTDTSSRTFIGGGDVSTGYSLSAAEMLRLFGGNITINAPRAQTQGGPSLGSNRPPDVVIGAFTLQGGATTAGNLGANGTLTIDTPGSARVNGAVALEGMSASNRFVLNATEAIEVIAGAGSIRMSNGGTLSGILDLRSDDIAVATSAAINAISGLTDIDLIDDRLGQSDGVASDEGVLAAAGIRMTARNGVYIQNTGTGTRLADRRGFTTGAGGLTIVTAGPATRIVINGRIPNAAGTFATGRDTIPLIAIVAGGPVAGAGQFDQGSTANGCLIANPAACFEGDNVPPVQDIIDDSIGNGTGIGDPRFNLLIELRDLEPLPGQPLIDDPVTGTGNDDLWEAPCEPAEGQETETCP